MERLSRRKPLIVGLCLMTFSSATFALLALKTLSSDTVKHMLLTLMGPFAGIITLINGVKDPFIWYTGLPILVLLSTFIINPNKLTLVLYVLALTLWVFLGLAIANISV